jgi:hypothetical protein
MSFSQPGDLRSVFDVGFSYFEIRVKTLLTRARYQMASTPSNIYAKGSLLPLYIFIC